MNPISTARPSAIAVLAALALFAIAGCNRTDDNRSAGQMLDSAVATSKIKAEQAKDGIMQAGRDANQTVGNAADRMVNASNDLAITAAVKAKLAGDSRLSALAINVDTSGGRVVLRGSAPDSAAQSRASELARSVEGVATVENDLSVQAKP